MLRVLGTWINFIGIVLGGLCGLLWKQPMSNANQIFFKNLLGALTLFAGLRLAWVGLAGSASFLLMLKQFLIVLVALTLGKLLGRLMHLQKASNHLGQFARDRMAKAAPTNPDRFSDGFIVCTLLFCAAPLGIVGAMSDGLDNFPLPLSIKAAMDGMGALGFAALFGAGVVFSAVPVLVFQGILSLSAQRFLFPLLEKHDLLDPVNTTSGFLIVCIALIIFEVRRIEVTDYLPALAIAPLLAFWLA